MALPELYANSPTPGSKVQIANLGAAVLTTPAANTVEAWTLASMANVPAALLQAGQFRFVIDGEICLDITGGGGTARQVMRGVEGSTIVAHANGAQVFHYLTAGALQNLITQAQPPAGTFSAYTSAAVQIGAGAAIAKVALNTKDIDLSNWFDNAANYRFQPTVAGYYQITAGIAGAGSTADGDKLVLAIYKNGAQLPSGVGYNQTSTGTAAFPSLQTSGLIYLNGTTDYVELWGRVTTAANAQEGVTFSAFMTGFMAIASGTFAGPASVCRARASVPHPLINYVTNPSFEYDATAGAPALWQGGRGDFYTNTGSVLAVQGAGGVQGVKYCKVTTPGTHNAEGIEIDLGVIPAGTYNASVYVKGTVGAEALALFCGQGAGNPGGTQGFAASAAGFVRYNVTFTSDGIAHTFLGVRTTAQAVVSFNVDGFQITSGVTLRTYADGDSAGTTGWLGTKGQTISFGATGGYTNAGLDLVTDDPGNNYSAVTGLYTCPAAGRYQVNGQLRFSTVPAVGLLGIMKNGAAVAEGGIESGVALPSILTVSDIVNCAAGDTISLGVYASTFMALNLAVQDNYMSVVRVA